jgi:hypothetical protein
VSDLPDFSQIRLFWEISEDDVLTLALSAPGTFAPGNPQTMMAEFLNAIRKCDIDIGDTLDTRVRVDRGADTFMVMWRGPVERNAEFAPMALKELSAKLGITSYGEDGGPL